MTDYKKYIYALRKCAKEHEHYRTITGRIIVSDLCRDTANLLETLEQEPKTGHWIDDKCSVCGKGTEDLISSSEWYRNEEPNFCPFCGVKLVELQEEEYKE